MKNKTNVTKYAFLSLIYDLVFTPFFTAARKKSFDMLGIKKNDKVLLVGVGTGLDIPLITPGAWVTGVDLSPAMLEKAEKKKTSRTQLIKMNAEKLQFKSGAFDVVVLNLILSVVEKPSAAMREAYRVLKKGGRIMVWDKFAPGKKTSLARKALNVITSLIGTDITRNFEDITQGMKLKILNDEAVMFGGNYRTIIIRK